MSALVAVTILISIAAMSLYATFALRRYLRDGAHTHESAGRASRWFSDYQPFLLPVFMIVFLVCVIVSTFHYSGNFLPDPPSTPGSDVVSLFRVTAAITGAAFFLTQVLLFSFAFRFRKKTRTRATYLPENLKLEFAWTIIPLLAFLVLFLWGQKSWTRIVSAAPQNALEIEVVAEQFNWKVRYPGEDQKLGRSGFRFITDGNPMGLDESDASGKDDFVPAQMHIPKNRVVKLLLWSKDVIHSFYVPYFRTKMDAVPGMTTTLHFTATATTDEMRARLSDPDFNYEVACAELCGRMHFAMKLILVVDEPEQYEKWALQQETLATVK
ncbi:MAG TPA: cytochrome c oxidase subunit II [Chryseosolibacter sp.]